MIKPTFINLPDEKKQRLLSAAKNEFSSVSYNEASINKIIKEAEISRGSFYTYFDTKADLVRCLLYEYAKAMTNQISKCLDDNNGDLFVLFVDIFDSTLKYTELKDDMALFHSLFKYMQTSGELDTEMIFTQAEKQKHMASFISKINTSKLNVKNEAELHELSEMLFIITKQSISKALANKESKEQAKQSFLYKLDILKKGSSL